MVIKQGEVAKSAPRAPPPSLKPAPAELGQNLKSIADPELKAVLESLAAGVAARPSLPRIG